MSTSAPRRENKHLQEQIVLAYEHVSVTADTTVKLWTIPTGRQFRVDGVWYNNVTGLAVDVTNFFDIQVLKGSTVMANWSTETGQEGALVADTPVDLTLSATDANRVAAAADVISLKLDEDGTATLPAGRIVIRGRLL